MMTATERTTIRVMVVDDSADHRMLMSRKLKAAGMEVRTAGTGEEALEGCADVDLVLLDYRLPTMSGLETLKAIEELPRGPSVVLVTAMGSTDVAVEAMRSGAIDYVTKNPGYLEALPNIVERAWRHHDLSRRASELQRLALLMHSVSERDEVVHEIVEGARSLLRASACALLLEDHGRRIAASVGETPAGIAELRERPLDQLPSPGEAEVAADGGDLIVALPTEPDEPRGFLGVFGRGSGGALSDELELVRAFAAFAGIALRNLRRRELEASLIDELQRTVTARQDFIASVSHELRTPLTSIGGYSETLLQHWSEVDDDQKRVLLGRVLSNSRELGRLVEELIDVAALERGQGFMAQPRDVDLRSILEESLEAVEIYTRDRDVRLELADASVSVDPDLFRRTVANLVSNAIKYSPPTEPVAVRATIVDGQARIEVEDHGVGLDSFEAGRVFEPFWRAASAVKNAIRGTGIGLALVREYVNSMGGTIGVESRPGEGSTFWFTVPLS